MYVFTQTLNQERDVTKGSIVLAEQKCNFTVYLLQHRLPNYLPMTGGEQICSCLSKGHDPEKKHRRLRPGFGLRWSFSSFYYDYGYKRIFLSMVSRKITLYNV